MQKKKEIKTNKPKQMEGITLIALVITIIVLLILAGVTINLTLGENGIFKTAQFARKNYTNAQEKELVGIAEFNNTLNNIVQDSTQNGKYVVKLEIEDDGLLQQELVDISNLKITLENQSNKEEIVTKSINAESKEYEFDNLLIGNSYKLSFENYENEYYIFTKPEDTIIKIDNEYTEKKYIYKHKGTYLYKDGHENNIGFGEFKTYAQRLSTSSLVRNEDSITVYTNCDSYLAWYRGIGKEVLSDAGFSKICLNVVNATLGSAAFGVGTWVDDVDGPFLRFSGSLDIDSDLGRTYVLDITGCAAGDVVGFLMRGTNTTNVTFNRMWLEK